MKKQPMNPAASSQIFRILYRYEPMYLLWSALLIVTTSLLPLLYVYAPKFILEALTNKQPFSYTLNLVLLYGIVLLILNAIKTILENRQTLSSARFTQKIYREVGNVTMSVELSFLESASTVQTINLAGKATSITVIASYIGKIISNTITIIGLAYIITMLDLWCIVSILIVTLLKYVTSLSQTRYLSTHRKLEADNNRVGNYVTGLAYFNPGAAKEVRVNTLQQWILNKVRAFRHEMVELQYEVFKRDALYDAILTITGALQSLLILVIMSHKYMNGIISIAEFTMIFSAVTALTSSLSSLGEQINQYRQQVLIASDYKKLLEFVNNSSVPSDTDMISIDDIEEIVFDHVTFSYPGSRNTVLKNVNLRIKKGEKLVIVGLNGSGKSTLIKLLCKFYRPASGRITVNGHDIWSIPNNEYYKLITAVFQDYANFAFSIYENVCLDKIISADRVASVLKELGLKYYDKSRETYITKILSSDGIDLSGGEGQKIAIARAVLKNAQVLLLDEPTASLDIKSEVDIYDEFLKLSEDKTTIFISHRLACVCVADKIAVFKDGEIVEYGNHENLLAQQGLYSEMYRKQSKAYVAN